MKRLGISIVTLLLTIMALAQERDYYVEAERAFQRCEYAKAANLYKITYAMIGIDTSAKQKLSSECADAQENARAQKNAGNIEQAKVLFKKLLEMNPNDAEAKEFISEYNAYPSWYDSSTMKAVHLNDGGVLILYTELVKSSLWTISGKYHVSGITGDWNVSVNDIIFDAIRKCKLYVPADGLYESCSVKTECSAKSEFRSGKNITIPYDSKTWTLYLMSDNGKSEIDCGSYTEKGYWNGARVVKSIEDSRKDIDVYFYPSRIIKKYNDVWNIESAENTASNNKKDVKVKATATVEVKTNVPRSSYCK